MPRVDQRSGFWFYVFLVLMLFGGICAIGYWQSYDIKCGGFGAGRAWVWTRFPPQFECKVGY